MKKSDIGVVAFMYLFCAFFYWQSFSLSEESSTYPRVTIALLFGLTTLYLFNMIINARKFGVASGRDEAFEGFRPVQFIVCLVLTLVYLLMMKYLGFFTATVTFMLATLFYLKVSIVHTLISVVAINLLIYVAFVLFLGVRLPAGLLI